MSTRIYFVATRPDIFKAMNNRIYFYYCDATVAADILNRKYKGEALVRAYSALVEVENEQESQ